jgi:hypothetical protein
MVLINMYQNPVLNAPPGPDGLPTVVDPQKAQDDYEVRWSDAPQRAVTTLLLTQLFHRRCA